MTRHAHFIVGCCAALGLSLIIALGASVPAHAWAEKCRNNVDAQIDEEYRIYFYTSGNELDEEAVKRIDRASSIGKARDVKQICIVGQASKEGDARRNSALALGRAEAVAEAFVARGWQRDQIVVRSKGESWGFLSDWLTSDSSADRRVDITYSY
ncbi:OmpA family protein [Pyruvatibacter sp.]|uniref:OmpA family protein n=1 Tax=Pyruvatibacter sp. TaxID=1981328 RepID=UPI0032EC2B94